jgi:beta-carotene 15,15'-dioxygenase
MSTRLMHTLVLLLVTTVAILTKPFWLGTTIEWMIAAVLILFAGIPHGSLDHLLAKERNQKASLLWYVLGYLAAAGLFLAAWLLVPGLAFLFFLLITAWHFAETDVAVFGLRKIPNLFIFLYGLSLTIWLLWQDTAILEHWTNIMTKQSELAILSVDAVAELPVAWCLVPMGVFLFVGKSNNAFSMIERLLFLVFIFLLSKTSLLIGFTIYFTGWHSVNAMMHIRQAVFSRTGMLTLLKNAIPVTFAAIVFLGLVAWLSNGAWLKENAMPALLVLLSILTLPHMTEMHRLYSRNNAATNPNESQ